MAVFTLVVCRRSCSTSIRNAWPGRAAHLGAADHLVSLLIHVQSVRQETLIRPSLGLPDAAFKADLQQALRFDCKFHRKLLQHFSDKTVDEQGDSFFLANTALADIEELVV